MLSYGYRMDYYTNQCFLISGENVKIGDGNTRVFAYDVNNDWELRGNDSYDEAIQLLEVRIKKFDNVSFIIFHIV